MENYEQLNQVGMGASSRVFGARRRTSSNNTTTASSYVVIKRYTGAATIKKFRDAALLEATTLKRLSHPHIMPVLDCFGDNGDVCVVFPFATGGSVFNVLRGDAPPTVIVTTNPGGSSTTTSPVEAWTTPSNTSSSISSPNPGTNDTNDASASRPFHPLTSLQVSHIAVQIASALAYIHDEGIMHRDIKPENLMLLSSSSSTPNVTGTASIDVLDYDVLLSDFGVVAVLEDSEIAHTFVGTRAYMAPEVLGEEPYGKPADIFSFGATLFTCATGVRIGATPAVRASLLRGTWTLENTVAGLTANEKLAWNNLTEELRDLIADCLKMKPEDRLTARQAANHPAHASLRAQAEERQRKLAEAAQAKALLQQQVTVAVSPLQSSLTRLETELTTVKTLYNDTVRTLQQTVESNEKNTKKLRDDLSALQNQFTASENEKTKLRTDVNTLRTDYTKLQTEMEKLKEMIKTNATSIKPSPGLTFGGFGNSTSSNVTVKSIRNRTTRIVYTDPSMLFANAVLRNGEILVGGQNNSILVLDPANFTLRTTIKGHTNFVYDILELPDGSVATCSYDQNLLIFDPLNGSIKHTLRGHTGYVYSIVLLPDGRIASGSSDKNIRIWNTSTGKCEQVYGAGHNGHVYILAVVDEGNGTKRLVSGNGGEKSDTGITFWNITSGATERKLLGHDGGVCSLHALPNNRLVSGCLTDNVIRVWDLTTYKCIASLPGHSSGVACMVVTPDGKRLVTGGYDFAVRVWNLTKFSLEKEFIGHTAIVRSVCLTHDGDILSCGDDKTLRLWNME